MGRKLTWREKKPQSVAVLPTARRTRSGTSGLGDCWDSADVIPSPRCSGPVIPPTLQSPHMSQEFLSLDHLLSCVLPTLLRFVAECNKKIAGLREIAMIPLLIYKNLHLLG